MAPTAHTYNHFREKQQQHQQEHDTVTMNSVSGSISVSLLVTWLVDSDYSVIEEHSDQEVYAVGQMYPCKILRYIHNPDKSLIDYDVMASSGCVP